ncbi:DUF1003 domain-containing protein [Rhodocytophaga rosea]|uniref:DUF1003 domain-containing protein n=1 Tax=Rhodocytophaga rosea TaxID=2704465 RepID=A0A6C0GV46_9BACT|nr:DUF1003 domain-containing protein [Rhodocytophaga rosea]QHT71433.1 DUF1003 domain-containing protein [Rhodocytophaga rosea]
MATEDPLKELLESENQHVNTLNDIVLEALQEEDLITRKVMETPQEKPTVGNRISDKVAEFGGSWKFILSFSAGLVIWIFINTVVLIDKPFDPYPFILLNLILSCVAALQAPVIMMSQNRKEAKDRKRAENDYLVNLKAEVEIRNLHRKIDLLLAEDFRNLCAVQKIQIEMLEELKKRLDNPVQGKS